MFYNSLTLFTITLLSSTAALAQQGHHHHTDHHNHNAHDELSTGWNAHVDVNLYATDIYKAAENDEEGTDIFTHSHAEIGYKWTNHISANGTIVLEGEPIGHSHGGAGNTPDSVFDKTALFVEELTINYDADTYGVYAGKFKPVIGLDVHTVPGWWGPIFFEEFEIREQIGFGGYKKFDTPYLGTQQIDISTYVADTSFLNESVLYQREPLRQRDGGPSNTGDLTSFAINLSGDTGLDALTYYTGFARRAVNDGDGKDENRSVFGLQVHHPISDDLSVRGFADITDIRKLDGEIDHDRIYQSVGFGMQYQSWSLGGSYTHIDNTAGDADENMDGYDTQISVGYNFGNGFKTDLGYQRAKTEGEVSNRVGILVNYAMDF